MMTGTSLRCGTIALGFALLAGSAWADDPASAPEKAWDYSVSVYGFDIPESQDYLNPNVTVDHDRLHLEARYQYEATDTTSVWAGANFSVGEKWVFDATVMLGGVFGDIDGVAPGYRMSLVRGPVSVSSEGEYLFDVHDSAGDFFYCWNEFTVSAADWFRLGLAAQRTRAYETGLSIQRGLTVGITYKKFDVAAYVFNPDQDEPAYVVSMRLTF